MAESGDVIDGRWVVESVLGRGGMGSVYRCAPKDGPQAHSAIKVLALSLRGHEGATKRFVREAEVLMRLDHPAIVQVHAVQADAERPYIEMEFIEGQTLADRLEEGELEAEEAVEIGIALFEALAYLHGQDVQHRDIKPDNLILRVGGGLVLVDFGLALDASVSRLTQANMAFGTVAYAPPEWLNPEDLDPVAWDLYAGGVVLWELLTSRIPFPSSGMGDPRQQALQVIMGKQTAPPLDPGEEFPPLLRVLVRELTHPKPDHRPPSAASVLHTLIQVRAELDGEWDADATPPSTSRSFTPILDVEDTHVPAPYRSAMAADAPVTVPAASRVQPGLKDEKAPVFVPPAAALGGLALLVAVAGAWYLASGGEARDRLPSIAATMGAEHGAKRNVDISVPGLPDPALLSVMLDQRHPDAVDQGQASFSGVDPGPHTLRWAYGSDCDPQACPGPQCHGWCGHGEEIVEVSPGEGDLALKPTGLHVPSRQVRVRILSLENPKRGWFKRKVPLDPSGWLGETLATVDGADLVFSDVLPGRHQLGVSIGLCEGAEGCWPDEECPQDCSSSTENVPIDWADTPLLLVSDLPLPD